MFLCEIINLKSAKKPGQRRCTEILETVYSSVCHSYLSPALLSASQGTHQVPNTAIFVINSYPCRSRRWCEVAQQTCINEGNRSLQYKGAVVVFLKVGINVCRRGNRCAKCSCWLSTVWSVKIRNVLMVWGDLVLGTMFRRPVHQQRSDDRRRY
jgi:hypothetical protein